MKAHEIELAFECKCLNCSYDSYAEVSMSWVAENGTPICPECGDDMVISSDAEQDEFVTKDDYDELADECKRLEQKDYEHCPTCECLMA